MKWNRWELSLRPLECNTLTTRCVWCNFTWVNVAQFGGIVALSVEHQTCDQEVMGLGLSWAHHIKTLYKFLTPMFLCHQAI